MLLLYNIYNSMLKNNKIFYGILINIFMEIIGFCFVCTNIQLIKYYGTKNSVYATILIILDAILFFVIFNIARKTIDSNFGKYTKILNFFIPVMSLIILLFLFQNIL